MCDNLRLKAKYHGLEDILARPTLSVRKPISFHFSYFGQGTPGLGSDRIPLLLGKSLAEFNSTRVTQSTWCPQVSVIFSGSFVKCKLMLRPAGCCKIQGCRRKTRGISDIFWGPPRLQLIYFMLQTI